MLPFKTSTVYKVEPRRDFVVRKKASSKIGDSQKISRIFQFYDIFKDNPKELDNMLIWSKTNICQYLIWTVYKLFGVNTEVEIFQPFLFSSLINILQPLSDGLMIINTTEWAVRRTQFLLFCWLSSWQINVTVGMARTSLRDSEIFSH